jgi:hypothetical protein
MVWDNSVGLARSQVKDSDLEGFIVDRIQTLLYSISKNMSYFEDVCITYRVHIEGKFNIPHTEAFYVNTCSTAEYTVSMCNIAVCLLLAL